MMTPDKYVATLNETEKDELLAQCIDELLISEVVKFRGEILINVIGGNDVKDGL